MNKVSFKSNLVPGDFMDMSTNFLDSKTEIICYRFLPSLFSLGYSLIGIA